MPEGFIEYWNELNLQSPPYIHPQDLAHLPAGHRLRRQFQPIDFEGFIASSRFGDGADNEFHLSLLPTPYGGDLAKADIIILMLNPGFSYCDYYAEYHQPACRERLVQNLTQQFEPAEFPFMWLDPRFCWHSGFVWWETKLRGVISSIASMRYAGLDDRYHRALRCLSSRLAVLELFPYHSTSFRKDGVVAELPSAMQACAYAHRIVERANRGECTVIVTRRTEMWGIAHNPPNVIVYPANHARSASLGPETMGGKAILDRIRAYPCAD